MAKRPDEGPTVTQQMQAMRARWNTIAKAINEDFTVFKEDIQDLIGRVDEIEERLDDLEDMKQTLDRVELLLRDLQTAYTDNTTLLSLVRTQRREVAS